MSLLIRAIRVICVPKTKKAWLLHIHNSSNNKIFLDYFIAKRVEMCNFALILAVHPSISESNN